MCVTGTDKNKQGQKGTDKDRKGLSLLISYFFFIFFFINLVNSKLELNKFALPPYMWQSQGLSLLLATHGARHSGS